MAWTNSRGDQLAKRLTLGTPRMPSLFHQQALHDYYQQIAAAAQGALLGVELLHAKGVSLARCFMKLSQSNGGIGFVGMLTLAFRDFSYAIRLQTVEQPGDEVRMQGAWLWLQQQHPGVNDLTCFWYGDQQAQSQVMRRCLADDEYWDTIYPDHPLSRLRGEFARLIPTLSFSREVKNGVPHRG